MIIQTSNRIELKNASIAIGNKLVLKSVNWVVKPGEHWVITGNSGTGKTVLAGFLAFKHRLTEGHRKYPFLGDPPSIEAIRANIRMVTFTDTSKLFQNTQTTHYYQQRFNAFDSDGHLTVRQYLELEGNDIDLHKSLLQNIGIYELLDLERIKLSSGQTRKMLLTKALLTKPKILIIDNAYIGLDQQSRQSFNHLLDELAANTAVTLILSGHHLELPNCITHRFQIFDDRSTQQGELPSFNFSKPAKPINFGALEQIQQHFKNKIYEENFESVIAMDKINIQFGNKPVLQNLTWSVKPGEKWVVYGPNGAGKTILLSLIYADNPKAYANTIYLFDKKRGSGESIWDIKRRIGFTSPELHAYFRGNNTAEGIVLTGLTDTFVQPKRPGNVELELCQLLFDYFHLTELSQLPFNQLSTGTQRLLLFIRALIKIPPVLLLDEPFQGMDENQVELCRQLLDQVLSDQQTLIFISHYREEWPACIGHTLDLSR